MKPFACAALLCLAAPVQSHDRSSELDLLLAKDACEQLLLTYGEGLDETDPAKVADVFAEDGVWTADGRLTTNSRAELREVWDGLAANKRPTVGVHAISNIRFEREGADLLTGSALVTMHRYNPERLDEITTLAAQMLVRIDMRCARTEEGWRFKRMELRSVSIANYVHGKG